MTQVEFKLVAQKSIKCFKNSIMKKVKIFHVGNKKGLRKLIKLLDEQGVQHTLTKKTKVNKHYGIEYTIKNGVIALIEHAKVIELMKAAKKAA